MGKELDEKADMVMHQERARAPLPDRYTPVAPNGKKCEFTGLGHARLYALLNGQAKPFVRVASLREPGKKRGSRLFHVGDMLRFLDRLAARQANCDLCGDSKPEPGGDTINSHGAGEQ